MHTQGLAGRSIFLGIFGFVFFSFGIFAFKGLVEQNDSGDAKTIWIGLAVAAIFSLVGIGIMIAAIKGLVKSKNRKKIEAEHPNQPWLLDKAWASGKIEHSNKASVIALAFFALFWNAISWTIFVIALKSGEIKDETWPLLFISLFLLIGAGMVVAFIFQIIKFFKYGVSTFELAEVPGVIGGTLGGVIFTKINIVPEDGFHLTLKCVHMYVTGSGKNSTTHRDTLWESSNTVDEDAMAEDLKRSAIPVLFDIPYDSRESEFISHRDQYYWELSIKAATPGVDYSSSFKVPVFKTDKSDSGRTTQELRAEITRETANALGNSKGLNIPNIRIQTQYGGGSLYEFKAMRSAPTAVISLLFGVGCGIGSYFIFVTDEVPFLIGLFLGLLGLLLIAISLNMGYSALTINTTNGSLAFRKRSVFSKKQLEWTAQEIKSISATSAYRAGNTEFFSIKVVDAGGKKTSIPAMISGRDKIERLIGQIEADLKS